MATSTDPINAMMFASKSCEWMIREHAWVIGGREGGNYVVLFAASRPGKCVFIRPPSLFSPCSFWNWLSRDEMDSEDKSSALWGWLALCWYRATYSIPQCLLCAIIITLSYDSKENALPEPPSFRLTSACRELQSKLVIFLRSKVEAKGFRPDSAIWKQISTFPREKFILLKLKHFLPVRQRAVFHIRRWRSQIDFKLRLISITGLSCDCKTISFLPFPPLIFSCKFVLCPSKASDCSAKIRKMT